MFKKILVPLDGSDRAEQAVVIAVKLAEFARSEIILLRVPDYAATTAPFEEVSDYTWMRDSLDPAQDEAQAYLSFVQNKIAHPDIMVRTIVAEGDRADGIVKTAVSAKIDLIVMSTHGRTGLSRMMLGSITKKVLQKAPCPVLAVRSAEAINRILIPLDGTRLSESALDPGLAAAKATGSRITLIRVHSEVPLYPEQTTPVEQFDTDINQFLPELYYENATQRLQQIVTNQQGSGVDIDFKILTGEVASTILDYIHAEKIGLVVMATHGRTGLNRLIYGSITEKILHNTTANMLIIRPSAG